MAYRRRRVLKLVLGISLGIFLFNWLKISEDDVRCEQEHDLVPFKLIDQENLRAVNKNLLFVGVMTAEKYLDSRAKTAYETWGKEVPGKVMFYSSENSYSEHVPLVALEGVDDSYPPQKKSFRMIKHIHDNFIDQYEWFMRADDDVYIRTDKLEELLRSVDSKKPWFIGQTGRGNNEEIGHLSLEDDENFCMGGPGVIFSRETLRRMAPYADDCYSHLYTTHEDVELGRCVRKYAGVACTWSYEMQVILYHNQSGENAFTGNLKQKEVHRAITLHPIKQPQYMYRLHNYVKGLEIENKRQQMILLHRDLANSMKELGYRKSSLERANLVPNLQLFPHRRGSDEYLGDTNILGEPISLTRYTPSSLEDVLEWEIISKTLYSHRDINPRKRIGSSLKEGLGDVVREIMELINSFSKQRGRVIDFKEILYGYWRLDPVHGVDLILDLLLVYRKYRGHKMTVQVRRHAYVQQTFSGIFIREVENPDSSAFKSPGTTELLPVHKKIVNQLFSKISENLKPILSPANTSNKTVINFILPLSGRYNIFKRFLKMYEDVCLKEKENTKLHLILSRNNNSPSDFDRTLALVEEFNQQYNEAIRIVQLNDSFSRGKSLQFGIEQLQLEDLLLFIDVDMIFDGRSLERIRRNTILGTKMYFPIVYSLYNPTILNKSYLNCEYSYFSQDMIDETSGFWRQFGFGIVSLFKSDYLKLGGFNLLISGWGNEDVQFFDNVVKSNLKIARSADPGLIHVFHTVECDEHLDLEQRSMCLGTRASTLGAFKELQRLFLKYKELFR